MDQIPHAPGALKQPQAIGIAIGAGRFRDPAMPGIQFAGRDAEVMAKYFKQSWTGNLYKATYNKLLARGEDDIFFSGLVVADFTGDGIADVLQVAGNNAYGQTRGATPSHGQFLLLAGYAVRRSCRYARKCRIAARADARSPARP